MSVLLLLLVLAIIGVIAWVLTTYLPMPNAVRTTIILVAVVCCVLYALHALGIGVPNPAVPVVH